MQFKQSVDKISSLDYVRKILPGHNELTVTSDFIQKVKGGFEKIESQNKLKQGSGIFQFDEFRIQL